MICLKFRPLLALAVFPTCLDQADIFYILCVEKKIFVHDMDTLIQTQNTKVPDPYETKLSIADNQYYYTQNVFDLTGSCQSILADSTKNKDYYDNIMKSIPYQGKMSEGDKQQIKDAYTFALCNNEAAVKELKSEQKRLNSSIQNLDDTKEFYNTMLIQTVNLGVGIVVLFCASIYSFYSAH